MSPLVSVIIPVYNCAGYVAEAIESALAQDWPNTEVVVVNDGSTDNSLAVLQGFGERIRLIDQKNAGPPAARNQGIAAARGDYIAFLDADDVWLQGKLSAQVRHMQAHPDVHTVFTRWHVWEPGADGRFVRPPEIERQAVTDQVDAANSGWLYHRLLLDCELLTTTVMLRASMVHRIGGFDLALWNGDDYDYWLRASREGKITKLQSVGALYRCVPGSVSRKPNAVNYGHKVLAQALARWGLAGPDGTAVDASTMQRRMLRLQAEHAHIHLLRGDPQIAFKTYRQILKSHPARLSFWVHTAHARLKMAWAGS